MLADSANDTPVGGPIEVLHAIPGLITTQINPTFFENSANSPMRFGTTPMNFHTAIKTSELSKPRKREWCCNELVILLSALWMAGLIFDLTGHSSNQANKSNAFKTDTQKIAYHISLAVMGVVLLFFVALLITTRLVYPDGKIAAYLVQEKNCLFGVLNFLIMFIILSNIMLMDFFSKQYEGVYRELARIYLSMSCIPKLMARLEVNLALCILMIVFEISMTLTITFVSDDHEQLAFPFYVWLGYLDILMFQNLYIVKPKVISERCQKPACSKNTEYASVNNLSEALSRNSKGILGTPDDGSTIPTPNIDNSTFTTGQSNNAPRNFNRNTHSDESKITQNVNIYVDSRTPNNNSHQPKSSHNSIDPENPEMQTSKSKPILVSKTSLPQIIGMGQSTSINVIRQRHNSPVDPVVSVEPHLPLNGPNLPICDMDSGRSISLVDRESVRVISGKLLGICQSDSCGDSSIKKITLPRNDNDRSLGDANWRKSHAVSVEKGQIRNLSPKMTCPHLQGVPPHQLQVSGPLLEKKIETNPPSLMSSESKPSSPFGKTITDKNYARIKKFISGKSQPQNKQSFASCTSPMLSPNPSPGSNGSIVIDKSIPLHAKAAKALISLVSLDNQELKCWPEMPQKFNLLSHLHNKNKEGSRKSNFSAEAPGRPFNPALTNKVLATIDQGVILVDSELCHIYDNIKHLTKKAETYSSSQGEESLGQSQSILTPPSRIRTVWDEIFDMDYIESRPYISSFQDCFLDYENVVFTCEYSCQRQLLAVYKYVQPTEKIPHIENIYQNIQAKKNMGLSSATDVNAKIGDFVYHRDGLSIQEFMRLMKSFIKRYTTDDDNNNIINKSRITHRKRVDQLLRGGNLEFCFVYKSFTISISVINLQLDKSNRANMTKAESWPYISICVIDMSDKYRLGFIEEKNTFKNLLLKSIQHELHTPITFVLAEGETIHSQFQNKYAELWENSSGINEILFLLEELGIKKDFEDAISFMRVALYNFTHMCILLQSFSDFASINSPDFILNIEKVNVPEAINSVVEMYHEFAKSKKISVEVNYPLQENAEDVYAWSTDEMRLQTIIGSLLHNAIKYSNFDGKVMIDIEKKGERLQVKVTDNGIGIKKEDLLTLDQVLKNHFLKWTTSNGSGICLGLKVVGSQLKYLGPRKHNEIKFDTESGEGCSVSFNLKKLDLQETLNPVSAFGGTPQGVSQIDHIKSEEDDSGIFDMSDAEEGEKCKSLQMNDEYSGKSQSPEFQQFGSARKHTTTIESPQCRSRKNCAPTPEEAYERKLKDVPLGFKMGWVTSPPTKTLSKIKMVHVNSGDGLPARSEFTGISMKSYESVEMPKIFSPINLPSGITNSGLSKSQNLTDLSTGLTLFHSQKRSLSEIEDKSQFGPRAGFAKYVQSSIKSDEQPALQIGPFVSKGKVDPLRETPVPEVHLNFLPSGSIGSELNPPGTIEFDSGSDRKACKTPPRRLPCQILLPEEINLTVLERPSSGGQHPPIAQTDSSKIVDIEMVFEKKVGNLSKSKCFDSELISNNKLANNSFPNYPKETSQSRSRSLGNVTTDTSMIQREARSKFVSRYSENHRQGLIERPPGPEELPDKLEELPDERQMAKRVESKINEFPPMKYPAILEENSKSNSSRGFSSTGAGINIAMADCRDSPSQTKPSPVTGLASDRQSSRSKTVELPSWTSSQNDSAEQTPVSEEDMDNASNNLRPSNFLSKGISASIRDCLSKRNLGSSWDVDSPISKLKEMGAGFVLKIKAEQQQKKLVDDKKPGFAITTADNCECKNILIVDDEQFNLKATSNILEVMDPGISFWKVEDGDEAVALCEEMSLSNPCPHCDFFRLVIMDFNMPRLGGMEATQQIVERNKKKMEESGITQQILVLGCTAYTDNNTKVEGKAIGMGHVMCKPYKRRHFVEAFVQIGLLEPEVMEMLTPINSTTIRRSDSTPVGEPFDALVGNPTRSGEPITMLPPGEGRLFSPKSTVLSIEKQCQNNFGYSMGVD